MYTQCPDCGTAFSVTAEILKQAAGKVRCGGCSKPFDALEHLSEQLPGQRPAHEASTPVPELIPELTDTNAGLPKAISPEQSAALLKTLDELAGADIQLEDTGVEWRIIAEQDVINSADAQDENFTGEQGSNDTSSPAPVDEIRFDDNTPLPDDFGLDDAQRPLAATPDILEDIPLSEPESPQADVALSESGDWTDILGEFSDPIDEVETAAEIGVVDILEEPGSVEEPQDIEDIDIELILNTEDSQLDFMDEQEESATAQTSIEEELEALEADAVEVVEDPPPENLPLEEQHIGTQTEEEQTRNMMIDEELMALAIQDEDGFASTIIISEKHLAAVESAQEDDSLQEDASSVLGFETIIMEGESILSQEDKDKLAIDTAAAAEIAYVNSATDAANEPQSRRMRYGIVAATVTLALLILVQVMHQSREALAKIPLFNDTIGPIYRALGQPLQPDWDITGWRFEATKGSADAEQDDNTDAENEDITIYSRLGNQSDEPLPYPMISISLTDRFEETIGSRMLEPTEYLSNDLDPRKLVQPGSTFNAVISIQTPSANTTGFKLNVCYRTSDEQLRCAIDDFK